MIVRAFFCRVGDVLSGLVAASSFLSLLLLSPLGASAQTTVTGQWTKVTNLPSVPVHDHLLPNGKVLLWGRSATGTQPLWDPATQGVNGSVPSAGYDLFCAGHTFLADGRLIVAGGHISDNVGLAKASIYDAATNTWTAIPDMNAGRWYPTATMLPNGDALVVSGNMDTSFGVNTLPQVYQPTNTWRNLTSAQLAQSYYPMMFVAPNGKVVDVAPTQTTRALDTAGTGAWSSVATHKYLAGATMDLLSCTRRARSWWPGAPTRRRPLRR